MYYKPKSHTMVTCVIKERSLRLEAANEGSYIYHVHQKVSDSLAQMQLILFRYKESFQFMAEEI